MRKLLILLLVWGSLAACALAQYTFIKPMDVTGADWTGASSINSRGDVAGAYAAGGKGYGFLMTRKGFTSFDKPDVIWGMNDYDDMVGSYPMDENSHRDGFLWRKGKYTTLAFPGADYTLPTSINNSGTVVGYYLVYAASVLHGFIWKDGQFSDYQYPGSGYTILIHVTEQGSFLAQWWDDMGNCDNFMLSSSGQYTSINVPWASPCAQQLNKMNSRGDLVGIYSDENGMIRGYARIKGQFMKFDVPGSVQSYPVEINSAGQITGWYTESDFVLHSFLAQPGNKARAPL